jgi:hypothetical protein
MKVCEFCSNYRSDEQCALGLKIPKTMSCREFDPGIKQFFANPSDYVSSNQIVQMAIHFGIKGSELKKVKQMASREETSRLAPPAVQLS